MKKSHILIKQLPLFFALCLVFAACGSDEVAQGGLTPDTPDDQRIITITASASEVEIPVADTNGTRVGLSDARAPRYNWAAQANKKLFVLFSVNGSPVAAQRTADDMVFETDASSGTHKVYFKVPVPAAVSTADILAGRVAISGIFNVASLSNAGVATVNPVTAIKGGNNWETDFAIPFYFDPVVVNGATMQVNNVQFKTYGSLLRILVKNEDANRRTYTPAFLQVKSRMLGNAGTIQMRSTGTDSPVFTPRDASVGMAQEFPLTNYTIAYGQEAIMYVWVKDFAPAPIVTRVQDKTVKDFRNEIVVTVITAAEGTAQTVRMGVSRNTATTAFESDGVTTAAVNHLQDGLAYTLTPTVTAHPMITEVWQSLGGNSGYDKGTFSWVEIWNGTNQDINLRDYYLVRVGTVGGVDDRGEVSLAGDQNVAYQPGFLPLRQLPSNQTLAIGAQWSTAINTGPSGKAKNNRFQVNHWTMTGQPLHGRMDVRLYDYLYITYKGTRIPQDVVDVCRVIDFDGYTSRMFHGLYRGHYANVPSAVWQPSEWTIYPTLSMTRIGLFPNDRVPDNNP